METNKELIEICCEAIVQHTHGLMSDYELLCYLLRTTAKVNKE